MKIVSPKSSIYNYGPGDKLYRIYPVQRGLLIDRSWMDEYHGAPLIIVKITDTNIIYTDNNNPEETYFDRNEIDRNWEYGWKKYNNENIS